MGARKLPEKRDEEDVEDKEWNVLDDLREGHPNMSLNVGSQRWGEDKQNILGLVVRSPGGGGAP